MADFHTEQVNAILDISGQVIRSIAPLKTHDALVQELNDRIWDLGRTEIQQVETIRRSLKGRPPIAYITTARALSLEQQNRLRDTLTALADHKVELELQTDRSLVASIRVRLGDMMMDNSIAGQLAEIHHEVSKTLDERLTQGSDAGNGETVEALVPEGV